MCVSCKLGIVCLRLVENGGTKEYGGAPGRRAECGGFAEQKPDQLPGQSKEIGRPMAPDVVQLLTALLVKQQQQQADQHRQKIEQAERLVHRSEK